MRSVAVCGEKVKELSGPGAGLQTVEVEGVPVTFGLIDSRPPAFKPRDPSFRDQVLVRVRGFSCNYRDRAIMFGALRRGAANSFYPVGSEFVAEVVEAGDGVEEFETGDRVIGDNHYVGAGASPYRPPGGIPTNQASKEYQVFHRAKLMKVPPEMPDEVAAAFSLGYQTAYCMVRKLGVAEGSNVLVTGARSNTSLFVVAALRKYGVHVYATTTSAGPAGALSEAGVRELIRIERRPESPEVTPGQMPELMEAAARAGGFDYVIDPFFDVHLPLAVATMRPGGKYITCGIAEQLAGLVEARTSYRLPDLKQLFSLSLINNYQFITSCLGLTGDLAAALRDYEAGLLGVTIDSVHRGPQVGEFFRRTYAARDRLGKVVYLYD